MPEQFGQKPKKSAASAEETARSRSFRHVAEPLLPVVHTHDTTLTTTVWPTPVPPVRTIPPDQAVTFSPETDAEFWEQSAAHACIRYIGATESFVSFEYSGSVERMTGGTLGGGSYLVFTHSEKQGSCPVDGDGTAAAFSQAAIAWRFKNFKYRVSYIITSLAQYDRHYSPMFSQWFRTAFDVQFDLNCTIRRTRGFHF